VLSCLALAPPAVDISGLTTILAGLATKSDLEATKADLATKSDLEAKLEPLSNAVMSLIAELMDPWENIRTNSSSINDVNAPSAVQICQFYSISAQYCMILGAFPRTTGSANVQRAHIWPNHTAGKGLDIFGLEPEDLCSPRNYMMMQAELEYLFDRKKFILVPTFSPGGTTFRLVVLYSALLSSDLEINTHSKNGPGAVIPWTDLHNKPISHVFTEGASQPFMRLLAQHTFAALKKAKSRGGVTFSDSDCDSFKAGAITLARRSLGEEGPTVRNVLKYNGFH